METESATKRKPCVLLVEDEPTQSLLLKKMLCAQCDVHQAFDGREALRMLYTQDFDYVLMDINLGDGFLSGFHLIDYIRMQDRFTNLRVIAVTGERFDALREHGSFQKFDDYVPKPVEPRKLIDAIGKFSMQD